MSNIALLFGAELNGEVERARQLRAGLPAERLQLEPRAAPKDLEAKGVEVSRDGRFRHEGEGVSPRRASSARPWRAIRSSCWRALWSRRSPSGWCRRPRWPPECPPRCTSPTSTGAGCIASRATTRSPASVETAQLVGPEIPAARRPPRWHGRSPRARYFPLTLRGRALSVLVFSRPPSGDLAALAARGAAALELAERYTDVLAGARRRRECSAAAELQQDLLPPRIAHFEGAEVAGSILPAYDVGGDWIDHCAMVDGGWLGVADAVGKGPQASAIGAIALGAYRATRRGGGDLADAAAHIHEAICALEVQEIFMSALLAAWDAPRRRWWLRCGHPPPMVWHAGRGLRALRGGDGPVLASTGSIRRASRRTRRSPATSSSCWSPTACSSAPPRRRSVRRGGGCTARSRRWRRRRPPARRRRCSRPGALRRRAAARRRQRARPRSPLTASRRRGGPAPGTPPYWQAWTSTAAPSSASASPRCRPSPGCARPPAASRWPWRRRTPRRTSWSSGSAAGGCSAGWPPSRIRAASRAGRAGTSSWPTRRSERSRC